jgi:hypothetical protein
VAHRAACCEQDTIPKPDGLAWADSGPEIERGTNEGRTLSGLVRDGFEVCSAGIRGQGAGLSRGLRQFR